MRVMCEVMLKVIVVILDTLQIHEVRDLKEKSLNDCIIKMVCILN